MRRTAYRETTSGYTVIAINIVLIDDHAAYREALRNRLNREPDLTVVGEAGDGIEAGKLLSSHDPDIVVMDVMMAQMNGIETTRRINAAFPGVKVLGLSLFDDRQIVEAMRSAGASGYVLKVSPFAELAGAIRTVAAGGIHFDPELDLPVRGHGPPADQDADS